jgi:uncharacterized short protein YbdD (DUF466 family)
MQTMHWYNPVTKQEEDVPAPMSYAQAIEMLSGHPDSDRFIEEYRRLSATHPDTIDALTLTGETFYREHWRGSLPGSDQPRTPCGSREVSSNGGFTRFAVRVRGVALMRGRRAFLPSFSPPPIRERATSTVQAPP